MNVVMCIEKSGDVLKGRHPSYLRTAEQNILQHKSLLGRDLKRLTSGGNKEESLSKRQKSKEKFNTFGVNGAKR